jgi:predicted CXXCH cytochrome family protein
MRTFAPRQRVDQAVEYAASAHGRLLAAGDTRVATCASCHGAHGIRLVSDARSPVHATNVADTCAACHADVARVRRPDGSSPPTTQRADYEKSVHFEALMKRRDLSAPTCNDCHGNHGATPPGVDAVANVCGTCHAVFAAKFETSVHQPILEKACVDCHGNHAIADPSDDMLAAVPEAPCSTCHTDSDDPGRIGANRMHASLTRLRLDLTRTAADLERVQHAGIEMGQHELALNKARDQLVLARTELHTFKPADVDAVVEEGLKATDAVQRAVEDANGELAFRRRGLVVSLSLILIVVVALLVKIRRLEQ